MTKDFRYLNYQDIMGIANEKVRERLLQKPHKHFWTREDKPIIITISRNELHDMNRNCPKYIKRYLSNHFSMQWTYNGQPDVI